MKPFEFKDELNDDYLISINANHLDFHNTTQGVVIGMPLDKLLTGWIPATGGKVSKEAIIFGVKLLKLKAFY